MWSFHCHPRCGDCAQIYREKLRAEVEGRPYTPPPPSAVKPVSRSGSSGSMSRSRSAGRMAGGGGNDSWDEWGDGGKVRPEHFTTTHAYVISKNLVVELSSEDLQKLCPCC